MYYIISSLAYYHINMLFFFVILDMCIVLPYLKKEGLSDCAADSPRLNSTAHQLTL